MVEAPNEENRVIKVNLDLTETNVHKNETLNTSSIFWTTDSNSAYLEFNTIIDLTYATASLVLKNTSDGSVVQRNIEMNQSPFYYMLSDEEIIRAGNWIGQIVVEKDGKALTSRSFKFTIKGNLLDTAEPTLSDIENYQKFYKQLADLEIEFAEKLTDLETQYAPRLTEVTAQLAQNERVLQGIDRTFSDETFGTLLELNTKYPNGNDERHVVATDGKWYWWNGSEWVPGQVAQSIGIADKSVGVKKIRSDELEVGATGYLLPINDVSWINRSINASGNPATVPTTDRILSSLFEGVKIEFSPSLGNGRVSIYKYNLDGTYIGQSLSGIRTSPILLEQGYLYRAFYAFDAPTTLDPDLVGSDLVFYGTHQPIKLQEKSVGIDNLDNELVTRINGFSTTNSSPKFMHLSSDDTLDVFIDIYEQEYASIFDNPVLGFLKNTHEEYGMTFSFYCWYETVDGTFNLTMFPSTYADEFKENSDWLKFGVHYLKANGGNFGSSTGANTTYIDIMTELFRICGGADSLDFIPRFHAYLGSLAFIESCRDSHLGLKGLLTSEDIRTNYYLDEYQTTYMQKHDRLFDYQNNLMLFSTDMRLEYTPDVTSSLSNIVNNVEYASRVNDLIIFTHEQYLIQQDMQQKIIECCEFAVSNGYDFDFPQNRI